MRKETDEAAKLAAKYINNTNRNLFLTGKAGTGKTTFLTNIRNYTYKNTVVAAPTGIAAINAGGITLHSLFHLPFGAFVPENGLQSGGFNTPQSVLAKLKMNRYKRNMLREMELLIIDEVSMLRADLLDCIDVVLRHVRRRKSLPFGGLQLLLIGDLHQLPPVVKSHELQYLNPHYQSLFFFESLALKQNPPVYIELEKIYRQSDQQFIDVLNRLRNNDLTQQDADLLNTLYQPDFATEEEGFIHVTTHNHKADVVNRDKLSKLKTKSRVFDAEITGDFPENMYPALEKLELKEGAQVMFIKNDQEEEKRFYNGKIGKIKTLLNNEIVVECGPNEDEILLEPTFWDNIKYSLDKETNEINEKITGSFIQFPLRLAWAITVHKSQGLTFDKAILDLSDVFAAGQMYVALSRLRSLDGLVLSSPIKKSIIKQDSAIAGFTNKKVSYEDLQEGIAKDTKEFINTYVTTVFDFSSMVNELSWHKGSFNKEENKSAKQQYLGWTKELINKVYPLKEVGEKFNHQVNQIIASNDEAYLQHLNKRIDSAGSYFKPLIEEFCKTVEEHIDKLKERKRIRGYIKEVTELESLFQQKLMAIQKVQLLISEMAENKILTKDKLQSIYAPLKGKKVKPKKRKDKTPTKEVSFRMYKEGKAIAEIAKERGLVEGTIGGHLCQYVAEGVLDVGEFLEPVKLNRIIDLTHKLDSVNAGELKSVLGNDYSYADIRFAIAHINANE